MMTELAVDVKGLAEQIKGKVKETVNETLLGLIPERQWQSLVEAEVKRIVETDLKEAVKAEVESFVREQVKAILSSSDTMVHEWRGSRGRHVLGEALMTHLKANIEGIVASAFSALVANELVMLRSSGRF